MVNDVISGAPHPIPEATLIGGWALSGIMATKNYKSPFVVIGEVSGAPFSSEPGTTLVGGGCLTGFNVVNCHIV